MNTDTIWEKFLTKIRSKVSLMSFNYIFKDLKLYSYENSKATIVIPSNELLLQNINKNYNDIIEEVLNDVTNDSCEIIYVFENNIDKIKTEEKKEIVKIDDDNSYKEKELLNYNYVSNLNPKYTFENFVVGESNKLAYGTALSVAKNPGKLYNPYFIYANSGLGKTHLMHAIGNYIVTHSDKRVLYITAEDFSIDYRSIVNSKDNNMSYLEAFRDKYRNVDVLIIDDIQYLENAPKSQIEFTNTFNKLYENEKQIIISSDTAIDDYKYLEERLKTRFYWGLTEYIEPPEIELKKNIIKNKIKLNNYDLDMDEDVIDYMANHCGNNVRQLEGAILRIVAYSAAFKDERITLDNAESILSDFNDKIVYKTNSISKIIDVVSKYYNLDSAALKGKRKKKEITDARAIAMYLSRIMTEESLQRIGLEFGGRDHSTVIHSYEKISNDIKTNKQLSDVINVLKNKICE